MTLEPRRRRWALAIVLGWGLLIRLFYGTWELDRRPYWDEKFNLEDTAKAVRGGSLESIRGYYSRLSYLPQALVLRAVQRLAADAKAGDSAVLRSGRLTPAALRFCRIVQAVYGTLLLWAIYRVGALLFDEKVGLTGAALAASSVFYIWSSAWFKPDALAALMATLTLLWTLQATERASLPGFLLAGAGIGLTAASKLSAAAVAIPLALSTLILGWKERRRWMLTVCAALTSVAVFLLTSPDWLKNLRSAGVVSRLYARKVGDATLFSALDAFLRQFTPELHGRVVGLFCWGGAILLAWEAARAGVPRLRRVSLVLTLVFPLVFAIALLAPMPYLKGNNLLPVVPVLSIAAALAMVRLGEAISRRVAVGWRSRVAAAVTGGLVLLPTAQGGLDVYRKVVPTTRSAAFAAIDARWTSARDARPADRVLFVQRWRSAQPPWEGIRWPSGNTPLTIDFDKLGEVDPERFDAADGVVFRWPATEQQRGEARRLEERSAGGAATVELFEPRLLQARGPTFVAVIHPWQEIERRTLWIGRDAAPAPEPVGVLPPDLAPGETISLAVVIQSRGGVRGLRCAVGSREVLLRRSPSRQRASTVPYVSERFRVSEPGAEVRLRLTSSADGSPSKSRESVLRVELVRWSAAAELRPAGALYSAPAAARALRRAASNSSPRFHVGIASASAIARPQ